MQRLSEEQIRELKRYTTPTIVNAIETFEVRAQLEGYTDATIRCLFPELGTVVAYACTAFIRSAEPPQQPRNVDRKRYWEWVQSQPGPKIAVLQDLSERPGGAYWGEVNSSIHRALGCVGVLTNGTVRDIDEVRRLGFHLFATGVHVSHGHAHLEGFGEPVRVYGMVVHPGDLIHADCHGAVVIPAEIAHRVAHAAAEVERAEKPILAACGTADMIEQFDKLISPAY